MITITNYEDAVRLAMAGMEEGYRYLYNNTCQDVYSFLYKESGGDKGKADSLISKVYETAWADLGKLAEPASFPTWVFGIAENLVREGKAFPVPPIGAHLPNGNLNVGNLHDAVPGISPNVANVKKAGSPNLAGGGSPNEAHVSALRNVRADGGASPNVAHQAGGGQADPEHALNQAGGKGPKTGAGRAAGKTGGSAAKKAGGTFFKTAAGKATIAVTTATVLTTAGLVTYNVVKDDEKDTTEATTISATVADTEDGSGNPTTESSTDTANSGDMYASLGTGVYLLRHSTITQDGVTTEHDYVYDPDTKTLTAEDSPAYLMYSAPVNPNEIVMPYRAEFMEAYLPASLTWLSGGMVHPQDPNQLVHFSDYKPNVLIYDDIYMDQDYFCGNGIAEQYDDAGRPTVLAIETGDENADFGTSVMLSAYGYDEKGRISYAITNNAGKRFEYETGEGEITVKVYPMVSPEQAGTDQGAHQYTVNYEQYSKVISLVDTGGDPGEIHIDFAGNRVYSASGQIKDRTTRDGGYYVSEEFDLDFSYSETGLTVTETRQGWGYDGNDKPTNYVYSATREYILLGTDAASGQSNDGKSTEDGKTTEDGKGTEDGNTSENQPGEKQSINASDIPELDALSEFLSCFEVYYMNKSYDCSKAADGSENILQSVVMFGPPINPERYPMLDYHSKNDSKDPEGRYDSCTTASVSGAKWVVMNIFNVSEADYEVLSAQVPRDPEMGYIKDDRYYMQTLGYGWDNSTPVYKSVETDGKYYYIEFRMTGAYGEEGEYGRYKAKMELKEIDGQKYWSVYSVEKLE